MRWMPDQVRHDGRKILLKEHRMAHNCEHCAFRARAEAKPDSFLARLWRWHTRWCPGWKAYQKSLAAAGVHPEGGNHE
jgi:hypothetical protein